MSERITRNNAPSVTGIIILNIPSQKVILLTWVGKVLTTVPDNDLYVVRFKSDFIYRQMQKWFDHLREVERESLYSLCKGMGSLGGGLAGFLFEGFAIQNTCRYSPTNDANTPIRHFGRMTKVETTSKKWPNRFIYRANDTRMISTSSSDNPELQVSPSDVLPVVADGCLVSFSLDSSGPRHDNPLFDAFFFSVGHGKVVIWILQMTIAHTHDGARSGFDLVSSLRKRASDAWREHLVEIKYVLIVPHVDSPCHVEWKFAAEFEAHEGEVYVQFLDVSVFHSVFQRNRDTIIPEIFGFRPEEAAHHNFICVCKVHSSRKRRRPASRLTAQPKDQQTALALQQEACGTTSFSAASAQSTNGTSKSLSSSPAATSKIKTRYPTGQSDTYERFLRIMKAYRKEESVSGDLTGRQRGQRKVLENARLYAQVEELFQDEEDLVMEFEHFRHNLTR
ncbi:hypothetical protein BJV74DRAFT_887257 [Russula compacta]|nr:hypothetical protein BJV74DRAFT_887257 [Russula compacta]